MHVKRNVVIYDCPDYAMHVAMAFYRKLFGGLSKDDEDANVAAIVAGKATFCHPQLRYFPGTASETPLGIDLHHYMASRASLHDKLTAVAAAFDCLSELHCAYRCYHLDAKATNFVVHDDGTVCLIDFETLCRPHHSMLPGRQQERRFDDMASGLRRFGFRTHAFYSNNADVAYRFDVFSLASSLFEHATRFLPRLFLTMLSSVVAANHRESVVEVLPEGESVVHRTFLRNPAVPIVPASLAAAFVRAHRCKPLRRTHSL